MESGRTDHDQKGTRPVVAAVGEDRTRQIVRQFRAQRLLEARASLLRCLLRDARVERWVQLAS